MSLILRSLFILILFDLIISISCDYSSHAYEEGEEVVFWYNKIGPYHNPQETYSYYSLPFCRPDLEKPTQHAGNSLGVILEGDELQDSGLLVKFKENQSKTTQCTLRFDEDSVEQFNLAVKNHYWYQMYIDELPIWGMVGVYLQATNTDTHKNHNNIDKIQKEEGGTEPTEQGFLYTHKDFSISFNGNQIIEVNLTSEIPKPIIAGKSHALTFSVTWIETDKSFGNRFDRYLDFDFFEHQIHWFSIFNSFMMVVFLCGLVALILMRTLKNDYARYTNEENSLDDLEYDRLVEETGWKQVHGDVFRAPRYLIIFAALIGTGYQLFYLAVLVISLTLVATLYDDRGSASTALLFCYSMTSLISGYSSGKFYRANGGTDWKRAMLITAGLYPAVCFSVAFFLNFIAVYYQSSAAFSLTTMTLMLCIWLFISCPLVLLGTIFGRSQAVLNDFPCRINPLKRPIPDSKWYSNPITISLFSGILPFGSIFIEMYFVFTSFWNYKFYYVYGFMFLVFVILLIVTVCVTIVSTYVLLNSEDYRWYWSSFCSGGSTAVYVYIYSIYYFFSKTKMSGIMQTCYYFGYMGMFCLGLFIMGGVIGFFGANLFVRRIYQYIKSD